MYTVISLPSNRAGGRDYFAKWVAKLATVETCSKLINHSLLPSNTSFTRASVPPLYVMSAVHITTPSKYIPVLLFSVECYRAVLFVNK